MIINKINFNLAQEIVNAVKEVVDKDINFIDINGIIIGSTDKSRLNTFHQAGYNAIKTLSNVTVEDNEEYKGSIKGINYPIKINNIAVGAIGITGEPSEVSKFGFLVTKITEIFIKEQQLNYKYEADKQRINYVVKSLIYNNVEDKNEIENVFKLYIYPNEFIALVNQERYNKLRNTHLETLSKYHGILTGGVGRLKGLYEAYKSYEEARIALKYSAENHDILTYLDSLNLELILESVDTETKNQYKDKVLKSLDEEDINLLEVYYKNDMSLKQTADELYVHKNTLQYRLERIYEKSGFNPRKFNESVILYLAIKLS